MDDRLISRVNKVGLLRLLGIAWALALACFWLIRAPRHEGIALRTEVLTALLAQYPVPVSLSPNGEHMLVKTRHEADFEVCVLSRQSGRCVATDRSADTQLSLTWNPTGTALAFQAASGGDRRYQLYLLDLTEGRRRHLDAPITRTAAFPLRWERSGDRLAYFRLFEGIQQILVIDTRSRRQPQIAFEFKGELGDFAWCPDGQRITIAVGGSLEFVGLETGKNTSYPLFPRGSISQIVWAPDGDYLLVAGRPVDAEYSRLYKVDSVTGTCTLEASPVGDVSKPLWIPRSRTWVYQVSFRGTATTVVSGGEASDAQFVARENAGWEVQGFNGLGKIAYILSRPSALPPTLLAVPLNGSAPLVLYPTNRPARYVTPLPELVTLKSAGGISIPCFLWRSPRPPGRRHAVLIEVHGGPRGHAATEWDAGRDVLLGAGWNVLAVDYRGSTGHGAAFEHMDDELGQVADVLAARDFAVQSLQARQADILLLGSSYGAALVAAACAKEPNAVGGAILLAMPQKGPRPTWPQAPPGVLYAFHGRNDDVCSPEQARVVIGSYFGKRALHRPGSLWEVLPGEGHQFHRTISWAKIYSAIISIGEAR
jgi:dipeptidyl aminopeptidase/acylaminoacyl peptidase